jgi:hypothetical protein
VEQIEKVKRTIHFYTLNFEFTEQFKKKCDNPFQEIFRIIIKLANTKAFIRYQEFGEKSIFIQEVKFEPTYSVIKGKLRCVRKDILPELMNTTTDEARGIEAKEEEGLVETTHFVIDYSKKNKKLAIEYNQFGAKIVDFVKYIENIGKNENAVEKIGYTTIVKDDLSQLRGRINRCSEFIVKVHKDNIEKIKSMDNGIYSSLKYSIDHFKSDYATLVLKFDYKKRTRTEEINKSIFSYIRSLVKDKSKIKLFNELSVKAEDSENNNLLETFDLLVDKEKSIVSVEKKKRYRTVMSTDLFEIMKSEINRKHI